MSAISGISGINSPAALPPEGLDLGPGRRRVTQQDLNMYRALVGGPPQSVQVRPAPATVPPGGPTTGADSSHRPSHRAAKTLRLQITDCCQSLSQGLRGPGLVKWVRRVSRDARLKIREARSRLAG